MNKSCLIILTKLTTGITSVVSISYILLSVFGLLFYFDCGTAEEANNFWAQVHRVYLLNADCPQHVAVEEITQSYTMFIFMTIILSFSVVNLFSSAVLYFQIGDVKEDENINIYSYVYVCSWIAQLVVDVVLGAHLGIDISTLGKLLGETLDTDITPVTLRHGAVYLMSIALKGYVIYIINFVLIVLMMKHMYKYQEELRNEMHSIHTARPLQAFIELGSMTEALSPPRPTSDMIASHYSTNDFQPSLSWNKKAANSAPDHLSPIVDELNRQFYTYPNSRTGIERMPRGPPPPRKARVGPAPLVPAPDYSPQAQRRLKSVMKTVY